MTNPASLHRSPFPPELERKINDLFERANDRDRIALEAARDRINAANKAFRHREAWPKNWEFLKELRMAGLTVDVDEKYLKEYEAQVYAGMKDTGLDILLLRQIAKDMKELLSTVAALTDEVNELKKQRAEAPTIEVVNSSGEASE